jgi:hypothetical protein
MAKGSVPIFSEQKMGTDPEQKMGTDPEQKKGTDPGAAGDDAG